MLELVVTLADSFLISRVNDEDDAVGAVIVVLPVGSDSLLSTDVPHVQLKAILGLQRVVRANVVTKTDNADYAVIILAAFTYQRFDVEALSRLDLGEVLVGELLEDGSLTSVVKTEHENLCLLDILAESSDQFE